MVLHTAISADGKTTIFWEAIPYEGKPLTRVWKGQQDGEPSVGYGGDSERQMAEELFALEVFGWTVK